MQSDKPPSDSSYPRDPRSVPPWRKSHYNSSQQKRSQSRDSDSGRSKRKDIEEDDNDSEQYNFEKLKNFQIPRKKAKGEKELLNEISLSAREYTHTIYQTLRSSFFDPQSSRKVVINQVEVVRNEKLEKEYLAKKKDMKDEGRSEKDLSDSFGYLHYFKRSEVEKVCKDGVTVGHCNLTSLGKPDMGVYICKHADINRFSKWEDNRSGYIVMFKIIKGKTKLVTECRSPTTEQEPTPLYDCHITKLPINVAQSVPSRAYQAMQYYFYEYGDVDVVQRPRQVLPYAVLKYTFKDTASIATAGARTSRRESSVDEVLSDNGSGHASSPITTSPDSGFCHWRGMLLVKNGTFCPVEMRSHLDTVFNVANIDKNINIKSCLPLEKLKRQLPPTLMSRSAKKYNVIYRGRHYNTFTLHPTEEGPGLGKYRQLIGHLVQGCSAAFIPLRNNSSLYLLPLSGLTEEMGLRSSSPEISTTSESSKRSQCAWKNFLHVIIITPKALSSKINDQRVFNVVHTRKRKDLQSTAPMSSVRDALEHKLRQMNIDPSQALSSMEPDHQQKVYKRIKDKKKVQTSEKMLHNHYKEVDNTPSSVKADWKKKLYDKWLNVAKFQQELYFAKKKLKVIPSPAGSTRRPLSLSLNDNPAVDMAMDDNTEATFSDDEDAAASHQRLMSTYKIPKKPKLEEPAKVLPITNVPCDTEEAPTFHRTDPRMDPANKPKVLIQHTLVVKPKINPSGTLPSILRPSFKPLEELIFSENLAELLKHPEFSFTEKHCSNHKVTGFATPYHSNSPYTPWEENQPPISIAFTQNIPYPLQNADCPYGFEKDPLILSMLRAIHGDYSGSEDTQEEHDKVNWVRSILHNREPPSDDSAPSQNSKGQATGMARKIVEHVEEKSSPQLSSTDSGFVSSSAAGTPGDMPIPDSPSLKDIAAIIASALTQTKTQTPEPLTPKVSDQPPPKPQETTPDVELAAKALLEALTQAQATGAESQVDEEGVDMEIGSTPEQSPVREKSQSREPDPSTSTHTKDISMKSTMLRTPQHTQGLQLVGRDPLHPPQPHPPSVPPKMKIPREEATLTALQKVIPGLTKETLQGVLVHVSPLVTKAMAKMKRGGTKIVSGGMITKPTQDICSQKEKTEKLHPSHSTGKMTITLVAGKNVLDKNVGPARAETENTHIPGLDLVKGQNAESQPPKETTTKNPIEVQRHVSVVGMPITSGRPRFILPGGSGGLHYSATDLTMTTMTTIPRHHTPQEDTPSSAIPQMTTKIVVTPSTIGTIITPRCLSKEGSSSPTNTNVTSIGTIITPRVDRWLKSRGVGRNPLSHINPMQGPGPCYPVPPPGQGSYLASTVTSGHALLYPGQGFARAGDSTPRSNPPFYPPSSISQQNSELLRTILNYINPPKHDPRLAATQSRQLQTPSIYASAVPSNAPQLPSQETSMSSQIISILQQLSTTRPSNAPPPTTSASAVTSKIQNLPGLSPEDIQRIREKKEKMKVRKELCLREALQMREELNKNIKIKQKHAKKKSKSRGSGKSKPQPGSPESTNSSNSGDNVRQISLVASSEQAKSQFSLSQPASSKVLLDVAQALTDDDKKEPTVQTSTVTKPTGVVTPTPRSMESINTSTEVTSSSSPQDASNPNLDSEESEPHIPPEATEVILEIDTALSQLKQGLQAKRNNDELKESMGKLLQLVLKLDGGGLLPAPPVCEEQSTSSSTAIPTSQPGLIQNTSDQGDLRDGVGLLTAPPVCEEQSTSSSTMIPTSQSGLIQNSSDQGDLRDGASLLTAPPICEEQSTSNSTTVPTSQFGLIQNTSDQGDLRDGGGLLPEPPVCEEQSTSGSATVPTLQSGLIQNTSDQSDLRDGEGLLPAPPVCEEQSTSGSAAVPNSQSGLIQYTSDQGDLRDRGGLLPAPPVCEEQSTSGSAAAPTSQSGLIQNTSDQGHLRETLNVARGATASADGVRPLSSATKVTSSQSDTVLSLAESQTSVSPENISGDRLEPAEPARVFGNADADDLPPAVSQERDTILGDYENQSTITSTTGHLQNANVDEILAKLRPFIQDLNKKESQKPEETTSEPKNRGFENDAEKHEPEEETPKENSAAESKMSTPTTGVEPVTHTKVGDVQSPTSFTSQLVAENTIVRPQPTHLSETNPQVFPSESAEPMRTHPTMLHTTEFYSTSQPEETPPVYDSHMQRLALSSPMSESDRGSTPTMDERYPDPVRPRKRRRTAGTSHNSFIVFDPENSTDCKAISSYLRSVKGVLFNVSKMAKDLQTNVNERRTSKILEDEFCNLLPPGTIWVVFRTVDLKHLHLMPHLALLKAAGSHVQFVSADTVSDVKARRYKNILTGDGGIILPICPKTIVNNLVQFSHLMRWLIGQNSDGSRTKKWRIALHQHQLIALQNAEHCADAVSRRNAVQALELLCRVSKKKPKLAIELPEHECDMQPVGGEEKGIWNWYDSVTDEELVKIALPCLVKLQMERVRQLRHVVVLIDGDPGALCWKPVWRSGCCVTTMEKFVDFVCPKPAGSSTPQSTSCVLPLYASALELL